MSISADTLPASPHFMYSDIRDQICTGDILLCSGTGIFSELIKKATNSIWSHVAFIIRLEAIGRIMVLESVESIGVRTVTLSSYVRNYNGSGKGYPGKTLIARHNAFDQKNIPHLSRYAVDLLGYPYNTQDIIRVAERIGLKSLGISSSTSSPLQLSQRAFICSEYAYECYQSVGITIEHDPNGFIFPSDFAKTPEINAIGFVETT